VLDNFESIASAENEVSPVPKVEVETARVSEVIDTEQTEKPTVEKIEVHKFQPSHYSNRTGVLQLSPSPKDKVDLAQKGKVKRPNGIKYDQCWLMDCLFKNVNSLKSGVNFSKFLVVKYDEKNKIQNQKQIKKIRNTVAEINNKVSDVGGPKNLIKIQNGRIFVNSSYL